MVTMKGSSGIYEAPSVSEMANEPNIEVNTIFHELDSGKWYYYKTDETWAEIPNTGGGGGGDITSANVTAMTGYEIAEETAAIEATDTLNEAMGKLEKGVSDNETNISLLQGKTDRIIMDDTEDTLLFVQATQPTGTIPEGSIWINTAVSNV